MSNTWAFVCGIIFGGVVVGISELLNEDDDIDNE